jgi:hypothetical protein
MAIGQEARSRHIGAGVAVFTIVAAIAALLFSFGFLSGLPILLALLNVRRSRREGVAFARRVSWIALGVAVAAAAGAYWLWQYLLWDMHYHPGGGGPIPPPSMGELAFMPLVAGGVTLLVLVLFLVGRHLLSSSSTTH